MVQSCPARWVYNKYHTGLNTTGPTEMIRTLDWPTLESRHDVGRLSKTARQPCLYILPNPPWALPMPHKSHDPRPPPPPVLLPLDKIPRKLHFVASFFPAQSASGTDSPHSVATAPSFDDFNLQPLFSPFTLSYNPILIHPVYCLHLSFSLHSYILSLTCTSHILIIEHPRNSEVSIIIIRRMYWICLRI